MYLHELVTKENNKPNTFIRLFMASGNIFEGSFLDNSNNVSPNYRFNDKKYGEIWITPKDVEAFQAVDNLKFLEAKANELATPEDR